MSAADNANDWRQSTGRKSTLPEAARGALALIRRRRSISPVHMRADPIPDAWLEAILEAGRWAPTHGMNEPWRFVVFTGASLRELGEARIRSYLEAVPAAARKPGKEEKITRVHATVPVAIAIGAVVGANPRIPGVEDTIAAACAVENMMLAATALGVGSFLSTGALCYTRSIHEFIGFAPPTELLGFLFLGFPVGDWPESRRQPLANRVTYRD
jgi:nitroreductase